MNKTKSVSVMFSRLEWDFLSEHLIEHRLRLAGIPLVSLAPLRCETGTIELRNSLWSDKVIIEWRDIVAKKWNHE